MNISSAMNLIVSLPSEISVCLWGQPGIGKSWGVEERARKLKWDFVCLIASIMDVTDMSGIPWSNENDNFTHYKPHLWASKLIGDGPPCILLCDDLTLADEQVQGSFFQLTNERRIGGIPLRDNVRVIAAANRISDKAGVRDMPTPLKNRFLHLYIDVDPDSWCKWAFENHLDPSVVGFIRSNNKALNTFEKAKEKGYNAFATPRTWHKLSIALRQLRQKGSFNEDTLFEVGCGLVGEGIAGEFFAWQRNTESLVLAEDILKDPENCRVPEVTEIDIIYATISNLTYKVKQNPTVEKVAAALKYCYRIRPEDLGVIVAKEMNSIILDDLSQEDRIKLLTEKGNIIEKITEKWEDLITLS